MKIIEVTVDPEGKTKVETKGFSGSECVDASRALEQALGVQVAERKTGEFYSDAMTGTTQSETKHLKQSG